SNGAKVYSGGGGGISFRTSTGTGTPNVSLTSTIVAKNTHVALITPDLRSGPTGTAGNQPFLETNSLIWAQDGGNLAAGPANNKTGTVASPTDPMLAALANNGGATQTHALLAGSPAIDTGSNPASLTTDQRGGIFVRSNGVTDMGAFELQPTPPPTPFLGGS